MGKNLCVTDINEINWTVNWIINWIINSAVNLNPSSEFTAQQTELLKCKVANNYDTFTFGYFQIIQNIIITAIFTVEDKRSCSYFAGRPYASLHARIHACVVLAYVVVHIGRGKREGNVGHETADRCVRLVRNLNIATPADNCTPLPTLRVPFIFKVTRPLVESLCSLATLAFTCLAS